MSKVNLAAKVLLGALVWLVLSVPAALWASKALKARREEMERMAQTASAERLDQQVRRDRLGPPSWGPRDHRGSTARRARRVK